MLIFGDKKKLFLFSLLIALLFAAIALANYHNEGFLYISPLPNAKHVSPHTTIFFRLQNESPLNIVNLTSCVSIAASQSGKHACHVFIASDEQTVICRPDKPFLHGDTVTIGITPEFRPTAQVVTNSVEFTFYISEFKNKTKNKRACQSTSLHSESVSAKIDAPPNRTSRILPNGVSIPANFPDMQITLSENPGQDHLFLSATNRENFVMILDNNGYPVWHLNTPYARYDFKVQPNDLITMFVQKAEGRSFGSGYIALDQTFAEVDSFYAVHGYDTDFHELKILDNGHYLLIGLRQEKINLSEYFPGGNPNAWIQESAIQEFTEKGELVFLWRPWDHFDIADLEIEDVTLPGVRYPHMNALDIDADGHFLLSSRHLGEITKIHRQTGDIIWRLGGMHNQFTFVNDPLNGFSEQHDIQALGKNRYLLFDNGNLHQPPLSRAVEYELDTEKRTATLVWQFRDAPDKYASWMGNAQRLANGNTLINWARSHLPKPTEVDPQGNKTFEMQFIEPYTCYRIFRFDWQGVASKPYLIAEQYDDHVTLLFNKFGDTAVDYYNIYAGHSPHPTTLLDTSRVTLKRLHDLNNKQRYYFRVTAMNRRGQESPFSNEQSLFVNFVNPGENMVLNGDFSNQMDFWNFNVDSAAQMVTKINSDGQCYLDIRNGGSDIHDIQLCQGDLKLLNGRDYLFEFDAAAEDSRIIEAYVSKENDHNMNYSKLGPTRLSPRMQHFTYSFTMNSPSDFQAIVIFNVGASDIDVYIDNISLAQHIASPVTDLKVPGAADFQLYSNYPNPFNQETTISYRLSSSSHVRLTIYNIKGQLIRTLVDESQEPGFYRVMWNGKNQLGISESSGIYFYRLDVKFKTGALSEINKMAFIK